MFAAIVVVGVVSAVSFETGCKFGLEGGDILFLRVPVNKERLDLGAQEMIGAGGAEFSETGGILRIHKSQDFFIRLHGADETLLLTDLAAEPREDCREGAVSGCLIQRLVFGTPEGGGIATLCRVFGFDIGRGFIDEGKGLGVTNLGIVIPGDEPMLAHHNGSHGRIDFRDLLHGEAEFEPGTHPGDIIHFATKDLLRQFFATAACGNRNDRVRVHVIDMFSGKKTVQGSVDRGGTGIEIERGVCVGPDHLVLCLGFQSLVGASTIVLLKADELILIEGGKIFPFRGAQIPAGTLYPEDLGALSREGILLDDLGGGVTTTGVGDALVRTEQVGTVNKLVDEIELGGFGIVPEVGEGCVAHVFGV